MCRPPARGVTCCHAFPSTEDCTPSRFLRKAAPVRVSDEKRSVRERGPSTLGPRVLVEAVSAGLGSGLVCWASGDAGGRPEVHMDAETRVWRWGSHRHLTH